ncbi:MAG: DUF4129 domain-containing protein [Anaerolineaceae bacterium]|nr:DUF4129 domain-containing protein [Anaerolineaceae bacterium]
MLVIGVLILSMLPNGGPYAGAQEPALSVSQFWEHLYQTESLLSIAATQTDPTDTISQIQSLWEGVTQVQLDDGTRIPVDMSWIRDSLADIQPGTRETLHREVTALIAYHNNQLAGLDASAETASLAALAEVLRDPRFHYADLTPTPIPDFSESEAPQTVTVSSFAEVVLAAAGVLVIIVVFIYFARNLQVQPVSIETAETNDPTTADDAQDLATGHAQSQDYRSAIRYLYLASLLILDERGIIHYDASLTNREHLRYLKDKHQLYQLAQQVINAFEEVWYGYKPVDEAYYQHFRNRIDELNRMVT